MIEKLNIEYIYFCSFVNFNFCFLCVISEILIDVGKSVGFGANDSAISCDTNTRNLQRLEQHAWGKRFASLLRTALMTTCRYAPCLWCAAATPSPTTCARSCALASTTVKSSFNRTRRNNRPYVARHSRCLHVLTCVLFVVVVLR